MRIKTLLLPLAIFIVLVGACTKSVTILPTETTTLTATTTVTTATPTTITITNTETVTTTVTPMTTETLTLTVTATPATTTVTVTATATPLFDFKGVLFGEASSLNAFVEAMDRVSGDITINGGDSRGPSIPFTFDWGDGSVTNSFFPAGHRYLDVNRNYVVTVTAHYNDGTTDSVELIVRFISPVVNPISLPVDVEVTIPTNMVTLESRMPGYNPPPRLTVFDDSYFSIIPRSTVEYVLTVAASIQKDFANDDAYLVDGAFNQVLLRDPEFGGMYSLWYTSPVSFGVCNSAFQGTIQWSSFMHEMGHNVTLNSPADYYYGGKIDGTANAIFSESMAQIFQHATAYYLLNHYQQYGLSNDLAADIKQSALSSMRIVKNFYEEYLSAGKNFASWNDPRSPEDETLPTFMTIAYKFFEHAENSSSGYRTPLKRMMTLLQTFDENMKARYDQNHDTPEAEMFRATLMVAALSYAFETDLRPEFSNLNFPISDTIFDELCRSLD